MKTMAAFGMRRKVSAQQLGQPGVKRDVSRATRKRGLIVPNPLALLAQEVW
jgi:hypothetical protein